MKQTLWPWLIGAALCVGAVAHAATNTRTKEVLVLHSAPTLIPRIPLATGFELLNRGPNSIFCSVGSDSTAAVVNKAREIPSGGSWSGPVRGDTPMYCIAATADQLTGAATILTDAP